MAAKNNEFRIWIAVVLLAAAAMFAVTDGAQAQYRRGGGFFDQLFGGGGFGGGGRYQQQPQGEPRERTQSDSTRAPPPKKADKNDTPPTTNVLVLGDSMADWLAYGLEDAFEDSPEIGVVRKHKAYSGLIRYENRGDLDWPHVARDLLTKEKADYVVVMLGLNDRTSIREAVAPKKGADSAKKNPAAKDQNKDQKPDDQAKTENKTDNKTDAKTDAKPDADDESDQLSIIAPEPRGRAGSTEFRTERWAEIYGKKIDEMIAALKVKGVPVLWVGLPSIRGPRSTADAVYLNDLFRARAQKAGIVFVDVWDGFVDEGGKYSLHGPDVDGQTRRLRAYDGVHFTSYGARKLAHYVEREIRRLMTSRATPVALPSDALPGAPSSGVAAPGPVVRPLAGPVVPLTAIPAGSDELVGGGRPPAISNDPAATRVLVRGEPVAAPAGRADDFSWPRGSTASASAPAVGPAGTQAEPAPPAAKNQKGRKTVNNAAERQRPQAAPRPQPDQRAQQRSFQRPSGGGLFGIFR